MKVTLKELNNHNVKRMNQLNGEFVIDGRLILHAENNQIRYKAVPHPPTKKRYPAPAIDYSTYLNNPDKNIYLAYADGVVAGQITLHKNWNNYAYIEDIVVDANFRRLGIGRTLIDQAKKWARERQLPGLMLETQNNNLQACKFYESCGFEIGGFDKFLYKGVDSESDEIAMFWYYHFQDLG
jgi:ribosomal protein S18 acetylase RimI-like enzyme